MLSILGGRGPGSFGDKGRMSVALVRDLLLRTVSHVMYIYVYGKHTRVRLADDAFCPVLLQLALRSSTDRA